MIKLKSDFFINVLTLVKGTMLAHLLAVIVSPVISRVYTPEDFGVYTFFFAVISILGVITNGRYELAIMLPKKESDALNLVALSFVITFFFNLGLLLLLLVLPKEAFTLFGKLDYYFVYLIPFGVFFIGIFNVLNYFNNRKKYYHDIAKATVYRSIVMVVCQIVIGVIKNGPLGLLLGEIISRFVANIKLASNLFKVISRYKVSKIYMIALAKKYKKFPLYNLPSSLLDTVTLNMPFILMPSIFGIAISGSFSFAYKLVALPSSLLSKSVAQVLFQKVVENKANKIKVMPLLLSTCLKLIFIAIPIVVVVYIFGEFFFELVFGEEWKLSAKVSQYLAFVFFIRFIVATLSICLVALEELSKLAQWQIMYFLSTSLFFLFFMFIDLSFDDFILYFIIHEYIMYGIYLMLIFIAVRKSDHLGS